MREAKVYTTKVGGVDKVLDLDKRRDFVNEVNFARAAIQDYTDGKITAYTFIKEIESLCLLSQVWATTLLIVSTEGKFKEDEKAFRDWIAKNCNELI